jgi:hypothetical protein
MPPFADLAKVVTARSISAGSRALIGRRSAPSGGATDWMTANWPVPAVIVGSRRTATRVTPGATSLSSWSHLPAKLYSNMRKPVALPPGCARLSTKPAPTGSGTIANTIGTERVASSNAATLSGPIARMTSGKGLINSAACLRMRSASPAPHRRSNRTLRPSLQPNCWSPWKNPARLACPSKSPSAMPESTPMRRMDSPCCACATSDHTAAPPSPAMNSRRRIIDLQRLDRQPIPVGAACLALRPIFFAAREAAPPRLGRRGRCERLVMKALNVGTPQHAPPPTIIEIHPRRRRTALARKSNWSGRPS